MPCRRNDMLRSTWTDPTLGRVELAEQKAHLNHRHPDGDLLVWLVGVTGLEPVTSSL
jgi:hypothetical protein